MDTKEMHSQACITILMNGDCNAVLCCECPFENGHVAPCCNHDAYDLALKWVRENGVEWEG